MTINHISALLHKTCKEKQENKPKLKNNEKDNKHGKTTNKIMAG